MTFMASRNNLTCISTGNMSIKTIGWKLSINLTCILISMIFMDIEFPILLNTISTTMIMTHEFFWTYIIIVCISFLFLVIRITYHLVTILSYVPSEMTIVILLSFVVLVSITYIWASVNLHCSRIWLVTYDKSTS